MLVQNGLSEENYSKRLEGTVSGTHVDLKQCLFLLARLENLRIHGELNTIHKKTLPQQWGINIPGVDILQFCLINLKSKIRKDQTIAKQLHYRIKLKYSCKYPKISSTPKDKSHEIWHIYKTARHKKKTNQKNTIHILSIISKKINPPKLTQILELADGDIKTGVILFHMFKKLRYKKDPNLISGDYTTMYKLGNILAGVTGDQTSKKKRLVNRKI